MSKMSREKGAEAEREVGEIFKANRIDTFRTQNIGGKQTRGDLYGIPGFFIEVRRRERLEVERWMEEVDQEAKESESGLAPLLVTRRNRKPWMATIWLPDFIDLLKEAKSL